ncbi:MAG: BatA and WFA domain-containing protein [Planctomycetota bacterium]
MPFGLTFLAPLTGLIAAAIAIPSLVALYFLKLRRRPVRVSSTLLWQSAIQDLQVNTPFRWLRASWQLLLQLLVLALLLLALARPAASIGDGPASRLIVLIDRSASMSGADAADGRTRLADAKRLAAELLRRATSRGSTVTLIAFATEPRTLIAESTDRALLLGALESIEPTDQPGDLAEALALVEAFARPSDEQAEPPGVVLFSDGQGSGTVGSVSIEPESFTFVRVGPDPDALRDNIGIVAFNARREYDDPATLRVFARVVNASDGEPREATFELLVDAETIERQRVEIPPGADATISLGIDQPGEGVVTLRRTGAADTLAADDEASIVIDPVAGRRILVVQPGAPTTAAEYALVDAIAALEPAELITLTQEEFAADATDPRLLAGLDLIVFDRVRPDVLPPIPTLSFGAGLPIPGLTVTPRETTEDDSNARIVVGFGLWDRTHPIMRYVTPTEVRLVDPLRLVAPGPTAEARGTILAQSSAGPLIMLVEGDRVRRVVVGFELGRSNWWRDLSFPVFIANILDTLAGVSGTGAQHRTDEPVTVRGLIPGATAQLNTPSGDVRDLLVDRDGMLPIGVLDQAGPYTLDLSPSGRAVAVNLLDDQESTLGTADSVAIAGQASASTSIGAAEPQELWRWLVLAAVVLSTVEWWLYARRMRV